LIVFVEPPTDWLAVTGAQPGPPPNHPAIALAAVFVVLTLVTPLGDLFALMPLALSHWALVLGVFVAGSWSCAAWRWRLIGASWAHDRRC
jgi:hypothetical protein